MTGKCRSGRTVGLVLVGTYPWNASDLDAVLPRPLLPIAHQPLVSYAVSSLEAAGIRDVVLCGNRHTSSLRSIVDRQTENGTIITYVEDPMPRGSAGSVRDAANRTDGELFIVAEGTTIPNVLVGDVLESHRASGAAATVVVHPERRGREGVIHVSSGLYVFDRRSLDFTPAAGFFDIKENLIGRLHECGHSVAAYVAEAPSARILNVGTYLAANGWVMSEMSREAAPPGYVKSGSSLVHQDASVARSAIVVGSVSIGPGARVGVGSMILGPVSIGADAVIGDGAIVSRCAIWRRAIVGERAHANCSVIADGTIVEPRSRVDHVVRATVHRRSVETHTAERRRSFQQAGAQARRRLGRILTEA